MKEGKVVVVSGGSSGIGWACVERISREGYLPVIADLREPPTNAFPFFRVDVSREEDVCALWKEVASRWEVWGLVNSAGIVRDSISWKMSGDDFMKVIEVNLLGTFLMCREAIKVMRDKGGRIVNIASLVWMGNAGQSNYAASKAGVVSLTRTLAIETHKYGIYVNCVAPGAVDTPMIRNLPDKVREKLIKEQPGGEITPPEYIAHAVWFFLSPETKHITGQILYVDNGKSIGITRMEGYERPQS